MLLQIMCGLGNSTVNAILEYEIPEHVKKPSPAAPRSDTAQQYVNRSIFNEKQNPQFKTLGADGKRANIVSTYAYSTSY
jgi:hypothetical protein